MTATNYDLADLFADLVSEKRNEPALVQLFRRKAGEWATLDVLCATAGVVSPAPKAVAAWLPAPDEPDYAVVLWFDPETLASGTALYNAARLLRTSDVVGVG